MSGGAGRQNVRRVRAGEDKTLPGGRGFDPHRPLQMRVQSLHPQVQCYNESDQRLS